MLKFFLGLALTAALFVQPADASDDDLRALYRSGQSALGGISSDRLRALVAEPEPTVSTAGSNFSYSRAWLDSLPRASGGDQWRCLAEALYFEARGETVRGQFAVAEVIVNRVESGRFPDTLCGVIRQGTGRKYQCQFTYTCDGYKEVIAEPRAFEQVGKVARAIMDGVGGGLTGGATHYHTTAVRPKWSRVYTKTALIGVHVFYRHTWRTASN
jgi:spore germination cell wall hydrolase CwlJ-like protein